MQGRTLVWCVLFFLVGAGCPKPASAQVDEDLRGEWVSASAERGGKEVKEGVEGKLRFHFEGDKLTMAPKGQPTWTTTYVADTKKTPRAIDIRTADLPLIGIYKVEEDRLTICFGVVKVRPTEFATQEGDRLELIVLKRVRSGSPKELQRRSP